MKNRNLLFVGGYIAIAALFICVALAGAAYIFQDRLPALSLSTPSPTPVVPFSPSVNDVLETFRQAGLQVENVSDFTASDLPANATGGVKFYTPSLCDGCSSVVLIFDNEAHLTERKFLMAEIGNKDEAFRFWLYHRGRVLLRMGGLMPESEAEQYKQALDAM